MTAFEIFNNNKTIPLNLFCELMKLKPNEMEKEIYLIESAYNEKGGRVVSLHHVNTIQWMLTRIENLLYILDPDSNDFSGYAKLAALLRIRIDKIIGLEQRVFNQSRAGRRGVWM